MSWKNQAYACLEMKDPKICPPKKLTRIFEDPSIRIDDPHDALMCILNVLVTEARFTPQTSSDAWKKRFFYSVEYTHRTTGDSIFQLKYLPQGKSKVVHIFATFENKQVAKCSLQYEQYINDITQKDPHKVFKNIRDLTITFKDAVVWKMLAGAQDYLQMDPTFGMPVLPAEVKLELLYKMGAPELGRLSTVSHEFKALIEDPTVWRTVLFRDFPKHRDKLDGDCKELYRTDYVAKKKQDKIERENLKRREKNERHFMCRYQRRPLPSVFPWFTHDTEDRGRLGPNRRKDLAFVNLSRF